MTIFLGQGAQIVAEAPMIRRQGNGRFTGFLRRTYAGGAVVDVEFVVNAASREEVGEAYARRSPDFLGGAQQ